MTKILFPAIDRKDGSPCCPQKLGFEDTQNKEAFAQEKIDYE
jgi:hypothetical protein